MKSTAAGRYPGRILQGLSTVATVKTDLRSKRSD